MIFRNVPVEHNTENDLVAISDENKILDTLPQKLKTDVAINVHIKTLGKVQLFHDCDEALLRDLVLKLRPVLYLPGDYICRKVSIFSYQWQLGMRWRAMWDLTLRKGSIYLMNSYIVWRATGVLTKLIYQKNRFDMMTHIILQKNFAEFLLEWLVLKL